MRRIALLVVVPLMLAAVLAAQPRLTFDYPAIAKRLVAQLALKKGERVMSIAHPGVFDDLLPYIRYEVMRAGGIDLGVIEVLREPLPEAFETPVLIAGAREARAHYKAMFRDVDAAIMMPGATTAHPAYLAMQDWLKDDLTERRGRRTIHFHWIENGSAYPIAGQPMPSRPEMDAFYQRALLQTDYAALGTLERRFADGLRSAEVHITSPAGTDLRFRVGNRPANLQDGDASAARAAAGTVLVDKEIELPAGVVRIAPLEETVEGVVAFPPSQWDGRPVNGLRLRFAKGRIVEVIAASGRTAVEAELERAGDVGRAFREIGLGFNPLLAVPARSPWIPYYGYGAGVVRLSLGDNSELGGAIAAPAGRPAYVRWNFFTDLTITVGNRTWVKDGTLQ
jgi:leucyl aminopeptidase (aminopeptidase T)